MTMTGKFLEWTQTVGDRLDLVVEMLKTLVTLAKRLADESDDKFTYLVGFETDRQDGYAGGETGKAETTLTHDGSSELRDLVAVCPSGRFLITSITLGDGAVLATDILADFLSPSVQNRFVPRRDLPPKAKLVIEFKNLADKDETNRCLPFFVAKIRSGLKSTRKS